MTRSWDLPSVFDHVWWWRKWPVDAALRPLDRKGQECAVTARGALGSIRVVFPDGFTVITSATQSG